MAKELKIKFESPLLDQLAVELAERLGPGNRALNVFNRHMEAALKNAMKPGVKLLKGLTPRGPTGNLKRSVQAVARSYKKDRRWYGAVGYSAEGKKKTKINKDGKRTGSDLGYHQGLIEFGTGPRRLGKHTGSNPTPIASSISELPGLSVSNARNGTLRTKPKPPKGFFKKARAGETVVLAPMKKHGNIPKVAGMADDFMESALREDMKTRVDKAWKQLDYVSRKVKPK